MSAEDRRKIEFLAVVIGALIAVASFFGTFVLLPYRMDAAEKDIAKVQEQRSADHDLLWEMRGDIRALREHFGLKTPATDTRTLP